MHIIALYGSSNSGKTHTIYRLVEMISQKGRFVNKKSLDFYKSDSADCTVQMLYRDKLIAITTKGDARDCIEDPYERYGVFSDIYVCASHGPGTTTWNYLDELEREYTVVRMKKEKQRCKKDYEPNEIAMAEKLLCEIDLIINGMDPQPCI